MLGMLYFSSSSVVSRAFSARCVYSTFGHHPHPLGYLCAKFCSFCDLHCWASPRRKTAYSVNHSLNSPSLFDAPGTEALAHQFYTGPVLWTFIRPLKGYGAFSLTAISITRPEPLPQSNVCIANYYIQRYSNSSNDNSSQSRLTRYGETRLGRMYISSPHDSWS